ncbi:hypothetical protein RhiirC2_858593, partial [Rhizophagus irregularis]
MTTPPAPSVLNPDIPPPPRPVISAPSGDRPLSPTNTVGVLNKRSRTVSEDAMNVDITSPFAPAPNLISTVPSVITSPQNITTPVETVDASIHAPSNTSGKGKAVAFDIPERRPSPDGNAAAIKSAPSRYHTAAYLRDVPDTFKAKFTTNRSMCDEVDCSLSPQNLCHVCGRPGCSPSVCNPRTTWKVDDRLNKLYSRFNAGPRHGRQDSRQSRENSNSRSRSRSNSRSCNNNFSSSRSNNYNNNTNTSRPNTSQSRNRSTPTSPSDNPAHTLYQHIIDELKVQIKEIANTLHTLEETVSWMNDTITSHEYRLSELESMMNYDNPGDSDLYPPRDDHENQNHSYDNGWDDAPTQDTNSGLNLPLHTSPSLMDTSPDASFSALDPNSVLS